MSKYVALEGGDGSGKSTVVEALKRRLERDGQSVLVVREPGGTVLGETVRGLLLDSESLDKWAEVFLFAAQRAELVNTVVKPALEEGRWVISDRTYYSSIAYQGRGRGLGAQRIRELNELGLDGVVPDHVFVLDIDPQAALARQERPDRIGREGVKFQTEVRLAYQELEGSDPVVVILDGTSPVETIVNQIMKVVS
ncbi:MAG: dTMP kinase [Acidimicrobiia bacterium]